MEKKNVAKKFEYYDAPVNLVRNLVVVTPSLRP
jgi:hypothetical protein